MSTILPAVLTYGLDADDSEAQGDTQVLRFHSFINYESTPDDQRGLQVVSVMIHLLNDGPMDPLLFCLQTFINELGCLHPVVLDLCFLRLLRDAIRR